jgi:outer membrane protein
MGFYSQIDETQRGKIMMTIKKLLVVTALMFATGVAFANDKVVVLDLQAAILTTNTAKRAFEQLEKRPDYVAMVTKFESLRADLQKLQASAEKDGMTWSTEQQADFRRQVSYINADFEQEAKKIQAERQAVAQRVVQELAPRVNSIVEQLIVADKIGLVLNSQAAFHAGPANDITPKVTEMLNKAP